MGESIRSQGSLHQRVSQIMGYPHVALNPTTETRLPLDKIDGCKSSSHLSSRAISARSSVSGAYFLKSGSGCSPTSMSEHNNDEALFDPIHQEALQLAINSVPTYPKHKTLSPSKSCLVVKGNPYFSIEMKIALEADNDESLFDFDELDPSSLHKLVGGPPSQYHNDISINIDNDNTKNKIDCNSIQNDDCAAAIDKTSTSSMQSPEHTLSVRSELQCLPIIDANSNNNLNIMAFTVPICDNIKNVRDFTDELNPNTNMLLSITKNLNFSEQTQEIEINNVYTSTSSSNDYTNNQQHFCKFENEEVSFAFNIENTQKENNIHKHNQNTNKNQHDTADGSADDSDSCSTFSPHKDVLLKRDDYTGEGGEEHETKSSNFNINIFNEGTQRQLQQYNLRQIEQEQIYKNDDKSNCQNEISNQSQKLFIPVLSHHPSEEEMEAQCALASLIMRPDISPSERIKVNNTCTDFASESPRLCDFVAICKDTKVATRKKNETSFDNEKHCEANNSISPPLLLTKLHPQDKKLTGCFTDDGDSSSVKSPALFAVGSCSNPNFVNHVSNGDVSFLSCVSSPTEATSPCIVAYPRSDKGQFSNFFFERSSPSCLNPFGLDPYNEGDKEDVVYFGKNDEAAVKSTFISVKTDISSLPIIACATPVSNSPSSLATVNTHDALSFPPYNISSNILPSTPLQQQKNSVRNQFFLPLRSLNDPFDGNLKTEEKHYQSTNNINNGEISSTIKPALTLPLLSTQQSPNKNNNNNNNYNNNRIVSFAMKSFHTVVHALPASPSNREDHYGEESASSAHSPTHSTASSSSALSSSFENCRQLHKLPLLSRKSEMPTTTTSETDKFLSLQKRRASLPLSICFSTASATAAVIHTNPSPPPLLLPDEIIPARRRRQSISHPPTLNLSGALLAEDRLKSYQSGENPFLSSRDTCASSMYLPPSSILNNSFNSHQNNVNNTSSQYPTCSSFGLDFKIPSSQHPLYDSDDDGCTTTRSGGRKGFTSAATSKKGEVGGNLLNAWGNAGGGDTTRRASVVSAMSAFVPPATACLHDSDSPANSASFSHTDSNAEPMEDTNNIYSRIKFSCEAVEGHKACTSFIEYLCEFEHVTALSSVDALRLFLQQLEEEEAAEGGEETLTTNLQHDQLQQQDYQQECEVQNKFSVIELFSPTVDDRISVNSRFFGLSPTSPALYPAIPLLHGGGLDCFVDSSRNNTSCEQVNSFSEESSMPGVSSVERHADTPMLMPLQSPELANVASSSSQYFNFNTLNSTLNSSSTTSPTRLSFSRPAPLLVTSSAQTVSPPFAVSSSQFLPVASPVLFRGMSPTMTSASVNHPASPSPLPQGGSISASARRSLMQQISDVLSSAKTTASNLDAITTGIQHSNNSSRNSFSLAPETQQQQQPDSAISFSARASMSARLNMRQGTPPRSRRSLNGGSVASPTIDALRHPSINRFALNQAPINFGESMVNETSLGCSVISSLTIHELLQMSSSNSASFNKEITTNNSSFYHNATNNNQINNDKLPIPEQPSQSLSTEHINTVTKSKENNILNTSERTSIIHNSNNINGTEHLSLLKSNSERISDRISERDSIISPFLPRSSSRRGTFQEGLLLRPSANSFRNNGSSQVTSPVLSSMPPPSNCDESSFRSQPHHQPHTLNGTDCVVNHQFNGNDHGDTHNLASMESASSSKDSMNPSPQTPPKSFRLAKSMSQITLQGKDTCAPSLLSPNLTSPSTTVPLTTSPGVTAASDHMVIDRHHHQQQLLLQCNQASSLFAPTCHNNCGDRSSACSQISASPDILNAENLKVPSSSSYFDVNAISNWDRTKDSPISATSFVVYDSSKTVSNLNVPNLMVMPHEVFSSVPTEVRVLKLNFDSNINHHNLTTTNNIASSSNINHIYCSKEDPNSTDVFSSNTAYSTMKNIEENASTSVSPSTVRNIGRESFQPPPLFTVEDTK